MVHCQNYSEYSQSGGAKKKTKTVGSRAEVWHGNAKKTSGGLTKKDLLKNKHGRIVSKKKHLSEKKNKRLEKAGYKTKKGQFGAVKSDSATKSKKKSKSRKSSRKASKKTAKKRRKSRKR